MTTQLCDTPTESLRDGIHALLRAKSGDPIDQSYFSWIFFNIILIKKKHTDILLTTKKALESFSSQC